MILYNLYVDKLYFGTKTIINRLPFRLTKVQLLLDGFNWFQKSYFLQIDAYVWPAYPDHAGCPASPNDRLLPDKNNAFEPVKQTKR